MSASEEVKGDAPSLRESPKPSPDQWLHSGEYLPEPMRDFHDQKRLFKALDEVAQRSIDNGNDYIKDVNWIAAQCYVVDVFLWCMARRGYTLQRSRKQVEFADLGAFVTESDRRWQAQARAALDEALKGNRKDGSSQKIPEDPQ